MNDILLFIDTELKITGLLLCIPVINQFNKYVRKTKKKKIQMKYCSWHIESMSGPVTHKMT